MKPFHSKPEEHSVFLAGDLTHLIEVLHPQRHGVSLPYSLAHAYLEPGGCSLPHRLLTSEELYYFLSGEGVLVIDGERFEVGAGHAVLVPAGARQFLNNTGSQRLVFLCIVSPPWRAEDEEVEPRSASPV